MNEIVRKQILAIRDSGRTNMFDTNMMQYIANEYGYYELAVFLEEYPNRRAVKHELPWMAKRL